MKYDYKSYKSLMVVDRRLTKEKFIENAGLQKGKYAANMFSQMYDWIFSEATYVEDDYEKYYKIEYSNLEEFIHKKYCISKKILNEILSLKAENNNYIIIDFDEISTGYSEFINLVFSDELYDRFINYFLMKQDENKV